MKIQNTFVLCAEDCPVDHAVVPQEKSGKPTVASLEHQLLSQTPYHYTRDDLLVEVALRKQGLSAPEREAQREALRTELLRRPQACMRASPLPKSYGFGVHYDGEGRLAIYEKGSPDYARLAAASDVTVVKAMRNRRSS
ncbi:MAG TPA: DUF6157 family protein [Pseudomonadota bacterium]|nr:DUF6157 family protein [Pseudomonadota bacterium]HNK45854.1 DUF6157 family protein [Pseudomonadota bacterium]HNN52711.1 DUF6157 family protein [Pseudomonadota bacterium]